MTHEEQQQPTTGAESVAVLEALIDHARANESFRLPLAIIDKLQARRAIGVERYGQELMTHDGRDVLRDAEEEAVDLVYYLASAALMGLVEWAAVERASAVAMDVIRYRTATGGCELVPASGLAKPGKKVPDMSPLSLSQSLNTPLVQCVECGVAIPPPAGGNVFTLCGGGRACSHECWHAYATRNPSSGPATPASADAGAPDA